MSHRATFTHHLPNTRVILCIKVFFLLIIITNINHNIANILMSRSDASWVQKIECDVCMKHEILLWDSQASVFKYVQWETIEWIDGNWRKSSGHVWLLCHRGNKSEYERKHYDEQQTHERLRTLMRWLNLSSLRELYLYVHL